MVPDTRGTARLQRALQRTLGQHPLPPDHLVEQWRSLPELRRVDLVYNPWDIKGSLFLSALRCAGLERRPIVSLLHSPPYSRGILWQRPAWELFFAGSDALPSFSEAITACVASLPRHAHKARTIPMGPDARWYPPTTPPGSTLLAIGKSARDFDTFGRAATVVGCRARIVCPPSGVTPSFARFGENVDVDAGPGQPLSKTVSHYVDARAVAIPLSSTRLMAGHWVLCDALAMGRPVIMTRHPWVDLDIEAEGVGRWVEMGDLEGWCEALDWFATHPRDAMEMGRRGRALVDGGFNSKSFAHGMMDVFDTLLGIGSGDGRDGETRGLT